MNKLGYVKIFDRPKYRKAFADLYAAGYTDKEISEKLSVCESTTANYRRDLGIPGNGGTGNGGWRTNSTTRANYRIS